MPGLVGIRGSKVRTVLPSIFHARIPNVCSAAWVGKEWQLLSPLIGNVCYQAVCLFGHLLVYLPLTISMFDTSSPVSDALVLNNVIFHVYCLHFCRPVSLFYLNSMPV